MYSLHVLICKGCTDHESCEKGLKEVEMGSEKNPGGKKAVDRFMKEWCGTPWTRDICPKMCNACK